MITRVCKRCTSSFHTTDSRTVYCGRTCYIAARRAYKATVDSHSKATEIIREPRYCACGDWGLSPWHCTCGRWKPAASAQCETCAAGTMNGAAA